MQLLLSGFVLGFTLALMICDDLAERKLNNYLKEQKNKNPIVERKKDDKEQKS